MPNENVSALTHAAAWHSASFGRAVPVSMLTGDSRSPDKPAEEKAALLDSSVEGNRLTLVTDRAPYTRDPSKMAILKLVFENIE